MVNSLDRVRVCALQTFKNGSTITVESNNGGNIKLKSASTSADITRKDLYACKVGVGDATSPCSLENCVQLMKWGRAHLRAAVGSVLLLPPELAAEP